MDLVIRNARVYTVDPTTPWVAAVGVRDGRIAWVGDDAEAPAGGVEIDGAGRLVLPGFVDAHNHVRLGSDEAAVQLAGVTHLDGIRSALSEYASAHPADEWVVGEGFNYSAMPGGRLPTAMDLDGVADDRAVLVFSYDAHTLWLNREAMRRFGITRGDPDAPFGRSVLDSDGEPTGYLKGFAVLGISRAGQAALAAQVPNYSDDAIYRRLVDNLDLAIAFGITTVVEPQNSVDDLHLFRRARDEARLRSRLVAALFLSPEMDRAAELPQFEDAKREYDDDRLRMAPIKLYIDDVIEPWTAAMLEPYANRLDTSGSTFWDPKEFAELIVDLERRGFQTFTHATGDRGIRTVLDAVQRARSVNGPADRRHQIVHVECVHPDDLARFAELGVVACMQPRHCAPEIVEDWRTNVGPNRWPLSWPFRSLAASGATLAFSSDWNVAEMDPLVWLYTALTRANLDGSDPWVIEETVDLPTAVRAATIGSAFANFAEDDRGSVTPGKYADLIVLSENLFEIEPAAFLETHVDLSIVDGELVYERPD